MLLHVGARFGFSFFFQTLQQSLNQLQHLARLQKPMMCSSICSSSDCPSRGAGTGSELQRLLGSGVPDGVHHSGKYQGQVVSSAPLNVADGLLGQG